MGILTGLMQSQNQGRNAMFEVEELVFHDTGEFHDHERRSYETNVDSHGIDMVARALAESSRNGANVTASSLAGVAGSIIRPRTESEGAANIAGGWGTKRLRFTLTILLTQANMGSVRRKVLTGWTDRDGVDRDGNLDLNMVLHVNNNIVLRDVPIHTPHGRSIATNVSINDQVLVNSAKETSNREFWSGKDQNSSYSLRPTDIMTTIGTRTMLGQADFSDELNQGYGGGGSSILDQVGDRSPSIYDGVEVDNVDASFGYGISSSTRKNLSSSTYLSRLFSGLKSASAGSDDYLDDEGLLYDKAAGNTSETQTSQDTIFSDLGRITDGEFIENGCFTIATLMQADPDLDNKTEVYRTGGVSAVFDHTSTLNTSAWNRRDAETNIAEIVKSALVGIFIDTGIAVGRVHYTNMTRHEPVMMLEVSHTRTNDVNSMEAEYEARTRFLTEVVPLITSNGDLFVNVSAELDVFEECRLTIQIEDEYPVEFSAFVSADSLYSNVLTNNRKSLDNMADDILNISSNIETFGGNSSGRSYTTGPKSY